MGSCQQNIHEFGDYSLTNIMLLNSMFEQISQRKNRVENCYLLRTKVALQSASLLEIVWCLTKLWGIISSKYILNRERVQWNHQLITNYQIRSNLLVTKMIQVIATSKIHNWWHHWWHNWWYHWWQLQKLHDDSKINCKRCCKNGSVTS